MDIVQEFIDNRIVSEKMSKQHTHRWINKRVLIIGAARQGMALAKFLALNGAQIVINDQRSRADFQKAVCELDEFPIKWVFGGHPNYVLNDVEFVFLSGGVPTTLPLLVEARLRGIPLSNDSQLFLEESKCKNIIGITGSAGKTTTTALIGEIGNLAIIHNDFSSIYRKVWVGGNIGVPLISHIEQIQENDLVVMELSSFQLEVMTLSPKFAVILNITPNHLDRHETMQSYTDAKTRILIGQSRQDIAIINRDDDGAWSLSSKVKGKLITFGFKKSNRYFGSYISNDWICYKNDRVDIPILPISEIKLRGNHNLANVLAVTALAMCVDFPVDTIRSGVSGFSGVAHRLEFIRSWKGAEWFNDSIATAPERTIAAILSFDKPLVLLLGGRDKNLPWEELIKLTIKKAKRLILFGEAAAKIEGVLKSTTGHQNLSYVRCNFLKDAIHAAAQAVEPGDIVLLSPGGTSFDEFKDFEERGECFQKWVMDL